MLEDAKKILLVSKELAVALRKVAEALRTIPGKPSNGGDQSLLTKLSLRIEQNAHEVEAWAETAAIDQRKRL